MPVSNDRSGRLPLPLISLLALPALIFYGILFGTRINLPFADDYEILEFLIAFKQKQGFGAKLLYVLTCQHNEYKLILGHSIFALQYLLIGHVSFLGLCVIGDISILLLAIVLWKMFLPDQTDTSLRLALFIPVSWLVFQLSYAETLNWAEPALQNLYILVFSFAAFALTAKKNKPVEFVCGVLCLIFAIAASTNGFIAAFIGSMMLLKQRRVGQLIAWCGVTAAMLCLYAYRYNVMSSQSPKHASIFSALLGIKITFVLSFLGALGELVHLIPHVPGIAGSISLGILLCILIACLALTKRLSTNPAVNAAIAFVFLTAIGVAGIRSDLGTDMSTASRYRIYSSMLIILLWYLVAEHWLQGGPKSLRFRRLYQAFCVFAVLLSITFDALGYRYLAMRKVTLVEGMSIYEHLSSDNAVNGPVFTDYSHKIVLTPDFNRSARNLLNEARQENIYVPPTY